MKNGFLTPWLSTCVGLWRSIYSRRIASKSAFAPLVLCFFVVSQNAHAFGVNDLLSVGLEVGGKVVGAAVGAGVDKVKDAMRDPEAEAAKKRAEDQKVADKYNQALAEIERHREWSPLQREKGVMAVKKIFASTQQVQQFVQAAEARQKAQRDQIFTTSGLLGAVGQAALNTPSMAMAQADVMSKSPTMRSHIDSSLQQADLRVAAGIPQTQAKTAIALVDAASGGLATLAGNNTLQATGDATKLGVPENPAQLPIVADVVPVAPRVVADQKEDKSDAFSGDIGKKIHLEFVGSALQTKALREALQARGHVVTDQKNEADVTYLLEGEYVLSANKEHKGLTLNIAQLLDDPSKPIEKPEVKASGLVSSGFGKLFSVVAQAQGVNLPTATTSNGYRQQVLLVVARQPKEGVESRFSVLKEVDASSLEGVALAKNANEEMLDRLGVQAANSTL